MFDVVGKRRWFYAFSLLVTIPGLIFILLTPLTGGAVGLRFTIDYTGGTRWVIRFEDPNVSSDQVQAVFAEEGFTSTTVTKQPNGFFEIRTEPVDLATPPPSPSPSPSPSVSPSPAATSGPSASPEPSPSPSPSVAPSASPEPSASPSPSPSPEASPSASPSPSPSPSPAASPSPSPSPPSGGAIPTQGRLGAVATALQERFGPIVEQASLTTIGPVVSADLVQQAIVLILIGSLGILLWITFRFHGLKMGVAALIALLHDVVVVVGIFAILGTFFRIEIDGLFVTAMLTVIGFSVHDTIVVFDRIRENRARHSGEPFDRIVNHSILQTLGRSINTSFTTVLVLLALLLFGGETIRTFVLAMVIGIVSGTYSSIFNASQILVTWQLWEDERAGRPAAGGRLARRPAR